MMPVVRLDNIHAWWVGEVIITHSILTIGKFYLFIPNQSPNWYGPFENIISLELFASKKL